MSTAILPIPSSPRKGSWQSSGWTSFGETGSVDPPPVREPVLHRYQARARAAIRQDVPQKSFKKEGGEGVYFTPIIWSLIFAEVAALIFLTMIVFL